MRRSPAAENGATPAPPLTPPERRGRFIVVVIALVILLPPLALVASVVGRGYTPGTAILIRLAISGLISWCLFKGYDWARRWVPIVFLLDALTTVVLVVTNREWRAAPVELPGAALAVWAAIVLWRSDSVDAFWRRQAAARQAILSLGGGPG
jgi:hypothetical protein